MSVAIPSVSSGEAKLTGESRFGWLRSLSARVENSDALSSLLAIFDQGMISGTNFVTAVIIGRCCGAETLGLFSLVASAIAMTIGVQDQLITAPYVLYHNRKRSATLRQYAGSVLLHQVAFIVLVALAVAVCLFGGQVDSGLARTVTLILLIATPGILLRAFIREIALAHYHVLTVVLVDATVCVSQLAAVLGLFVFGAVNLPTVYCVVGASCILTAWAWLTANSQRFEFSKRSISLSWVRNWRFGRWALATHMAGTSTPYIMPWVLFAMHGERATGYLASCSVIVGVANILLSGMADFLTPRAAAAYADGGIQKLRKILRSMLGLSVLAIGSVCVVASLFGEQIINVLYDGRFPGAGSMVALLTLSVLANAIGNVAGNGLWALNKPRANFVADMVTLTVAIAAAPPLIIPYGAMGAALATLAASSFGCVCRQLIFHQAATEATRQ